MTHYTKILSKKEDEGVYMCAYWVIRNGKKILSYDSNKVNIMITDLPPSPSLSLSPSQPSYDHGQKITLICSPPNNTDVEAIRYYKNFTEIQHDKNKETMTHYTKILSKKADEGVYRCAYWVISDHGTEIPSYGSKEVNIMITDITPSWIYYIIGGVVFVAVALSSCLLYKRIWKGPHRVSGAHMTYHNPGHAICHKPVKNSAPSPLVQNQLNNPLYSVICQSTTPGNEQLLSNQANTWMTSDLTSHVPDRLKTSSASGSLPQDQEEAHIYSEICPKKNSLEHPAIDSEDSSLHAAHCSIYHVVQAPPPLSTACTSSPMENSLEHPAIDSEDSLLHAAHCSIYHVVQAPPPLSTACTSSPNN